MFGHFAEGIKFGRPNKSYHLNDAIDFRRIPDTIVSMIKTYADLGFCQHFNGQNIFFNLQGKDYVIWFRPMTRSLKGNGKEDYMRVQTFYPVELAEDISKIQKLQISMVNSNLSFYIDEQ